MEMNDSLKFLSAAGSNDSTSRDKKVVSAYMIPVELVVLLLLIILIVDLVGNSVVVLVIIIKRKMQTFTNWMILNLAVADLSVAIICIPLEIPLEIKGKWIYGKIFCKLLYPFQTATIYGSVFTLVVLSCSRYWAIIHPFRKQPNTLAAKWLICAIWATSFVIIIPYMMALEYDPKEEACDEVWSASQKRIYSVAIFTFQYILPLSIISVAYLFIVYEIVFKKNPSASLYEDKEKEKETKRLIKLLLIITITFAICVLPIHVLALTIDFGNALSFKYFADVSLAAYILLYLNSALNPVIYNIFSSSFREAFAEQYDKMKNYVLHYKVNRPVDSEFTSHSMLMGSIRQKYVNGTTKISEV